MSTMISYAQNAEDVILNRIFKNQNTGFYIDIGASHPEELSITKHFYDKGWKGVNVDPLPKAMELFNTARPQDINLNLAIGNTTENKNFYEVSSYPELSTFSKETADLLMINNHEVKIYPVPVITGTTLFEEYVKNTTVDFLKIDVEGYEYEVLSSIDFLKFAPRVLVIEATLPNSSFPGWDKIETIQNHSEWEHIILNQGYIFAYFDGLNRFYIHEKERDTLLHYFQVGLCHWDSFIRADVFTRMTELEYHCEERLKQVQLLSNRIEELEYHANNRLHQTDKLTYYVKELEYHSGERMKPINTLTSQIKFLTTQPLSFYNKLKKHINKFFNVNKAD